MKRANARKGTCYYPLKPPHFTTNNSVGVQLSPQLKPPAVTPPLLIFTFQCFHSYSRSRETCLLVFFFHFAPTLAKNNNEMRFAWEERGENGRESLVRGGVGAEGGLLEIGNSLLAPKLLKIATFGLWLNVIMVNFLFAL